MIPVKLFESNGKVYCNAFTHNKTLIFDWDGTAAIKEIIQAHYDTLALIEKYKLKYIIEDTSKFTGVFEEANQWFIGFYAPKIKSLGIEKTAVVLNQSIFTQLSVNRIKYNKTFQKVGIDYQAFPSREKAYQWLQSTQEIST